VAGRVLLTVLAALAVSAAPAVPAYAHGSDPTVVARIDEVAPPVDGVVVQVRAGVADQLLVVNDTDAPVEVLDSDGNEFIKVFRDHVEANVRSAAWQTSLQPLPPFDVKTFPPGARGTVPWVTVARHGSWGWFDHRMHDTDRTELTAQMRAARTPVRIADWTVPLRHRGRTHLVKGHVEHRPVVGAFRTRVVSKPEGVDVDVLDGRVPGLFVRWKGSGTLLVKGVDGTPFARFHDSSVEVDEASTTWREDRALRGENPPLRAEPHWAERPGESSLTWLDRRLAYMPGVPPDDVARSTKPTTMVEWDVPVEIDGRAATISGETTWHPALAGEGGSSRAGLAAAVAAGAAAVVVVTVVARGRRRRRVET